MITGYTVSADDSMTSTTTDGGDFDVNNLEFHTSTSNTFIINQWGGEITTESFEFKETEDGNFIEVVKRQKPNPYVTLTVYPPQEQLDRVFKEIYGVMTEDGKQVLKLIKTIEGSVSPGHYVDESIDFDE